ncbi:MAG TPA: hypothetical protein VLT33_28780, partial [Labilithrix sp.]|nr:hypothetical protein [Labilithrix sp.]
MLQGHAIDDSIHLVATTRLPPGESDAYSAATRHQSPLADMAALMSCGEEVEEDVEIDLALLRIAGPFRQASNDHGARKVQPSSGSAREWIVVAGIAVVGASAVFALS